MKHVEGGRWRSRLLSVFVALFGAMPHPARGDEHEPAGIAPLLADVVASFENLPSSRVARSFALGETKVPRGGHLQGIQVRFDSAKNRHFVFLTHDSETVAYLLIVEFVEDFSRPGRVVGYREFPSDGGSPPLRHAGGMQLVDDVLAVGLEDNQQKMRSEIQFWDVSIPEKPAQLKHLTVQRAGAAKDKTAGAAGLVRREAGHVLAVANWDSRAVDFYVASGLSVVEPACRFTLQNRWQYHSADTTDWRPDTSFGTYQAVNLVSDATGALFLVGLNTTPAGADVVDLFAIRLDQPPSRILRKLAQKELQLGRENHFRFAGGIWVDRGRLAILSSQRNLAPETWIGIAR